MNTSHIFYSSLVDIALARQQQTVEQVCIGLTWTFCRTQQCLGLAMSPPIRERTLSWPGTLTGRKSDELVSWVTSWHLIEAAVGLATINSLVNTEDNSLLCEAQLIEEGTHDNLSVFRYFYPALKNKRVVIIGRYPGIETALQGIDYTIIERSPSNNDLPDSACEFIVPEADWVFITASSIVNKTFPRLAQLASNAVTVLMGPSTPWLEELSQYSVDFIAGTRIQPSAVFTQTILEGGGTRIFEQGAHYAVQFIGSNRLTQLKKQIADSYKQRDDLKSQMAAWYDAGNNKRFPKHHLLAETDGTLSTLDSAYKRLWDAVKALPISPDRSSEHTTSYLQR